MFPLSVILAALLVGSSAAQDGPQTPVECRTPLMPSSRMAVQIRQLKDLNQASASLAQYGIENNSNAPLEIIAVQNAAYWLLVRTLRLMTVGEDGCVIGGNCTKANYTTAEQIEVTHVYTLFAEASHNYTIALKDKQLELAAGVDGHKGFANSLNSSLGQIRQMSNCVSNLSPTQKDSIAKLNSTLIQDYTSTIDQFTNTSGATN